MKKTGEINERIGTEGKSDGVTVEVFSEGGGREESDDVIGGARDG